MRIEKIASLIYDQRLFTSIMDLANMKFMVSLSIAAFLIIFLLAFTCFIYQLRALKNVIAPAPGDLNTQQRVQQEVQESGTTERLKKMQTLRKESLHEQNRRPRPRSTIWMPENVPEETDDPRAKDTRSQVSIFYLNEVDSGISDRMDSIKMDLENSGLHLSGPENTNHLRVMAINEWMESMDKKNTK